MLTVVRLSTSRLRESDRAAIATYLLGDEPPDAQVVQTRGSESAVPEPAHRHYLALCAGCHGTDGEGVPHVAVNLRDNSSVRDAEPHNLVRVILDGLPEEDFVGLDRMQDMPGFARDLSDAVVAALSTWLRSRYGGATAPVRAETVRTLRSLD
jgi:mono/diheme cytochrome c family protein